LEKQPAITGRKKGIHTDAYFIGASLHKYNLCVPPEILGHKWDTKTVFCQKNEIPGDAATKNLIS